MSYISTLFKWGGWNFPLKYIKMDTYDASPNQRQDLDSYTDANGLTHRNALSHTKTMVEFTTRQLKIWEYEDIMSHIVAGYSNPNERDCTNVSYYDFEYNTIRTGKHFYLDPSLKVRLLNMEHDGSADQGNAGTLRSIGEIKWTFIEY